MRILESLQIFQMEPCDVGRKGIVDILMQHARLGAGENFGFLNWDLFLIDQDRQVAENLRDRRL